MPPLFWLIGISATAVYVQWHTWLGTTALTNLILNTWSLGVLWNHRGMPISGWYERIMGTVSILTSVLGMMLVAAVFFIE
jgi:hypothetical protein